MWERQESASIPLMEALLRRLPSNDGSFSYYEERLRRERSGLYGEKRLDREWLDFKIQYPYVLLNGLKFENEAAFTHQVDTLFICPYFIWVLEAKNISGRIDIDDETNQCTRTRTNGTVEGFTNPVDQVRRHGGFVNRYLRELGISIPVVCGVVFANTNSIIGQVNVREVLVFHVTGLRYKVDRLFSIYRKPVINEKQMRLIGEKLIARRKLDSWKPKYDMNKLRAGVLCYHCNSRMHYRYGKWECPRCGKVGDGAFYQALQDYRLLWGEGISNSEFREFVGIKNRKTAYRLLISLGLESQGELRYKKYLIPKNIYEMSHRK